MFEQAFKNIDDVLWKDAGCTSELDYTEQTSWLHFLKYLDALEHEKATEASLDGKKYTPILDKPYRWETWAAPRLGDGKEGNIDHNTFLSNTDNASVSLRQKLLEECNLHTVLDCPGGTFIGAGAKTVVLFFEKGTKTLRLGSGQARKVCFTSSTPAATWARPTRGYEEGVADKDARRRSRKDRDG